METVTLPSGRRFTIRPLRPDDGPRLENAYGRLSTQTKYRRFLIPKPHLSRSDIRYLVATDGVQHVALVATTVEGPERIVAVARFVRLREDPATAEVAVVVGDPFQGVGLGSLLIERLSALARDLGVKRLRATILSDNAPAHRLVHHAGSLVLSERRVDEVDELEIALAA